MSQSASNVENDEEMKKYCDMLRKVSVSYVANEEKPSALNKMPNDRMTPAENILTPVQYQEPATGIDGTKLVHIMHRLHSFTSNELRNLLREVHMSTQGTKKQLRDRVKRYYRKEYAMFRMRTENEIMPTVFNKTHRHYDFLIAIDFECTCTEIIYNYPHEIIEFPAVLIDVAELKIVDKFRSYARPVINPILDPFCIQLCGINQEVVDNAPLFPEAFQLFMDWLDTHQLASDKPKHRYAFVTDGPHDFWKFFQYQCMQSKFDKVPHEFRSFINIKRIFEQRVKKLTKGNGQSGIQNMLAHYDMEFQGQKHSGLDDALNIARLCVRMIHDKIELRVNQRMSYRQDRAEERRIDELIRKDKGDGSDFHVWQKKLPLKLRQVSREEFLNGEFLECDTCDEEE